MSFLNLSIYSLEFILLNFVPLNLSFTQLYIVFFLQSCFFERFEFLKECVMMEGGRCDFLGMQLEKAGGVHWLAGGALGNCLPPGAFEGCAILVGGLVHPGGMCGTHGLAHPVYCGV